MNAHHSKQAIPHCMAISYLTPKQCLKVKSSIVDINNHLNQVSPTFDSLNRELSLGFYLIDTFSDCFFFYIVNQKDAKAKITYQDKLKNIYKDLSNSHDTMLIISNTNVKNNITTVISYIMRLS